MNRSTLTRSAERLRQRGVTLVELVISITIVSIASAAVLGVLSLSSTASADTMVRYQSVAVGNAYLEEILLKAYEDPNCVDGESGRANFDDINDYDGLVDVGARNQFDTALAGLESYRVVVAVSAASLGNPANIPALQATVTVTDPSGATSTFSGFRTNPGVGCVP